MYWDAIKYLWKCSIPVNQLGYIDGNFDKLLSELETLTDQLSGHSSSCENNSVQGGMPVGEVRRCLLYLSKFPKGFVFNRKRVIRFFSVHGLSKDCSCAHIDRRWLGVVENSWDGNVVPHHFVIGNNDVDVRRESQGWPELVCFGGNNNGQEEEEGMYTCRFFIQDATEGPIEPIPNETVLCSLIYLGKRRDTLDLRTRQFLFLRSLSLRNKKLTGQKKLNGQKSYGEHLMRLRLLRYLDLKHSDVNDDNWLEHLQELEMLDLRGTRVEKVSDVCLEKLVKL